MKSKIILRNLDDKVIDDFGEEWGRFDQSNLSLNDWIRIFNAYFDIFPWHSLPPESVGADIGCGSGRWAAAVAPRVAHLHVVDASAKAIKIAGENLREHHNITFHEASLDQLSIQDNSLDFAYSLGVLHHVPDTQAAICSIAKLLKPGAPLLVYLYHSMDDKPSWFRAIWFASDLIRKYVSRQPRIIKYSMCEVIALIVYFPFARTALLLKRFGLLPKLWPLAYYSDKEYYVMRTDALDRFGTRLEQRYTRGQVYEMLYASGIRNIRFSENAPFWCAVGLKIDINREN